MLSGFRHAGLVVDDLQNSLAFYERLLGLKIIKRQVEAGSYIDTLLGMSGIEVEIVKLGPEPSQICLELLQFRPQPDSRDNGRNISMPGFTHIALTVTDIEGLYKSLLEAGILFIAAPCISPDGYARVAFCRDPEGNYIELVEELAGK